MILGIDHLALSCEDIHDAAQILASAGYRIKFVEQDVPNHPNKSRFLKAYRSVHSIAYCQGECGTAIELTQHSARLNEAESPYQVLLGTMSIDGRDQVSPQHSYESIWQSALGCRSLRRVSWPKLHAQFWYDAASPTSRAAGIKGVLVPVADIATARHFWSHGLGLHSVQDGTTPAGQNWAKLSFKALMPGWSADVVLAEGQCQVANPTLDAPGFSCLAFLSSNLDNDSRRLWDAGATDSTGDFVIELGQKTMRLEMFRGPDNELIELIEILSAKKEDQRC